MGSNCTGNNLYTDESKRNDPEGYLLKTLNDQQSGAVGSGISLISLIVIVIERLSV